MYVPLLRNIFAPGGRLSIPAFNDANASSSETIGSRQLGKTYRRWDTMRQREMRTSSSLTHARIDIERGVSDGKGEDQGATLTPIFPTQTLEAVPPS